MFDGNTKCAETTREDKDAYPCVLHVGTQVQTVETGETEQNCKEFVGTTWDGSACRITQKTYCEEFVGTTWDSAACQLTQKTLGEVEGIKFRTKQGTAFFCLHRYPPLSTTTFTILGGGGSDHGCVLP